MNEKISRCLDVIIIFGMDILFKSMLPALLNHDFFIQFCPTFFKHQGTSILMIFCYRSIFQLFEFLFFFVRGSMDFCNLIKNSKKFWSYNFLWIYYSFLKFGAPKQLFFLSRSRNDCYYCTSRFKTEWSGYRIQFGVRFSGVIIGKTNSLLCS